MPVITGLSRFARRFRRLGDRGGITMLFVVFVSGGVLLGTSAIVADVGAIYAERGELQAGADAAAMAVAEDCARTPASCSATALTRAGTFGNGNARDAAAAISLVCGRGVPGLAQCGSGPTNRSACVTASPAAGSYVEVRTSTRASDNTTLLPPTLAQGMVGNDQYEGTTVRSCARASWGAPNRSTGFALTISTCEWSQNTSNGTLFAAEPPALPAASMERVIKLHTTGGIPGCTAGPSGWDVPGGFGWLNDPTSTCTTTVTAAGTYGGDPGASASSACKSALATARATHAISYIPVFDLVTGTGSGSQYHLSGMAAFVITGYQLPGASATSWLTGTSPCGGSDKCVYGYFTKGLLRTPADANFSSGTNLGLSVVRMSG